MLFTLQKNFQYFNPRSPHGERHGGFIRIDNLNAISIHAPRTGSDEFAPDKYYTAQISIHAPRTGSDHALSGCASYFANFNPRSPHGERPSRRRWAARLADFNPRSPHGERRATGQGAAADAPDFNPRSPHGERLTGFPTPLAALGISIHAPRTGSDIVLHRILSA